MNQVAITPRDRLIEVAEWLEAKTPSKAGVDGFDMNSWVGHNECGTTCCIGGAVVQFDQAARGEKPIAAGHPREISPDLENVYVDMGDYAGDLCGLNPVEADVLFRENLQATATEAAETVRRYLDTGKLYWSDDGCGEESDEIIRSRALPTKHSVLLGRDGKTLMSSDTRVAAVLNTATGVVRAWKPFGNKKFRHEAALATCESLPRLPGHTPWELAQRAGLKAILNSGHQGEPDADQYPDILREWYWAQEVDASSPAEDAWCVSFGSGSVFSNCRCVRARALAVCRPLPASQQ
jgi:hypothetical protein